MNPRFWGWARCHPQCNWFAYTESDDFDVCWRKLRVGVASAIKSSKPLISMVVLPFGTHPLMEPTRKR